MSLNTTIGGSTADSYVTVDEADAYHANFGNTDWADIATDALKEVALRKAAQYIDTKSFQGVKVTSTQALEWPRYNVVVDGYDVSSSAIPDDIKVAQMEAALIASTQSLTPNLSNGSVIEETVGKITKRYSDYTKDGGKKWPLVDNLLAGYVTGGGNFHRVQRV
jgi:hypothetical protein